MLVSITGSGKFHANEQMALAVYVPIQGSDNSISLFWGKFQL
jgi:hypothetical protein